MNVKRFKLGLTALFTMMLISLVFAAGAIAKDKTYRWRMQSFLPAGGEMFKLQAQFCSDVKKASNGRLDIKIFGAGQVMPVLETWEAVSKGVMEMNFTFGAYWTGKTKMAGASVGLPFTTKTMQEQHALLYDGGLENLVRKDYAKHGIHLLRTFPIQRSTIITKFPVASLADLTGKKIRAGGSEAEAIAASGIATAFFPVPEVYQALDSGVVDGVVMGGIDAARMFSFYEVTKYIVQPAINVASEEIHVNKKAFDNLPADLQHILVTAASKHGLDRSSYGMYQEMIDLEFLKEKGIKVQPLPMSDYKKMAENAMQIYEKWAAKDPAFAEALALIKAHMNLERF